MTATAPDSLRDNPRHIYKIAPSFPVPNTTSMKPADSVLPCSDLDQSSGFIHMSTAEQVSGTLKHFFPTSVSERNMVFLLKVSLEPLTQGETVLRWESPDAGVCGNRPDEGLFPHLYFDGEGAGEGKREARRLWLRQGEVDDIEEVASEIGVIGWEKGLKALGGWLV